MDATVVLPRAVLLSLLFSPFCLGAEPATEPLRIKQLQRCGDLLQPTTQDFCLRAQGLQDGELRVLLGGQVLAPEQLRRDGQQLYLHVDAEQVRSAPLWLEQGTQASNPVWLSLNRSQVLAAGPHEVAKNMDGLTTYLDLISLLIEENQDGLATARQLAERYGAQVVGSIPPLNVYQLRLPVKNLTERDALILRIGSEASVDAVIIEESAAEHSEESEPKKEPEQLSDDEWAANRFVDAVNYYQRRIPARQSPIATRPVRIGVIERNVDFDAADFADYLGACTPLKRTCLYARDADQPDNHGSTVAGILAARWGKGGNTGFLRGLDQAGPGFEVIVERNSDAGITANVAASVNLVEDGARILNWSWGIHRVGTQNVAGNEVDSLVRSGLAMSGYEELLEEFFLWLRREHPDVVVINSAGNSAANSGTDEYRLPSSFITEQLLVVGGHQRSQRDGARVDDPQYVVKRDSSNIDMRVDITASACAHASTRTDDEPSASHCGTSYATPMVTGIVAAMLSINPQLQPEQLRMLLRRSAMPIGGNYDFEPMDAEDLTAPILPSERNYELNNKDVGRSARLDMQKAIDLAVQSRDRVR
ncbi:MAG: S8/S53 family peptidase [Pseudomonas sp.]